VAGDPQRERWRGATLSNGALRTIPGTVSRCFGVDHFGLWILCCGIAFGGDGMCTWCHIVLPVLFGPCRSAEVQAMRQDAADLELRIAEERRQWEAYV